MSIYPVDCSDVKQCALHYVKNSFAVVPTSGKKPVVNGWQKGEICTEEEVKKVFKKHPSADNIGLVMGLPNLGNCWALDVDLKSDGHLSLEKLIAEHGPLPEGPRATTGGGGKHYLFKLPSAIQLAKFGLPAGYIPKNSVGQEARKTKGIDVRAAGGQIIVYPSVHPETKCQYVWDEVEKHELPEPPDWLVAIITQPDRDKLSAERKVRQQVRSIKSDAAAENPNFWSIACIATGQKSDLQAEKFVKGNRADIIGDIHDAKPGTRHDTLRNKVYKFFKMYGFRGIVDDVESKDHFVEAGLACGLPYDETIKTVRDAMETAYNDMGSAYYPASFKPGKKGIHVVPPPPPSGGNGDGGDSDGDDENDDNNENPQEEDNRPTINVNSQESDIVDQAFDALLANHPNLFQLPEGGYVEVFGLEKPEIKSVEQHRMRLLLAQAIRWVNIRTTRNGVVVNNAQVPQQIPNMMLRERNRLPILRGTCFHPVITKSETDVYDVVVSPGYHASSGLFMADHKIEIVNAREKYGDNWAKVILDHWLCDWPFATQADRTHALAMFLAFFVRPFFAGPSPLHLIEAAAPNSGKTILCKTLLHIPTCGNTSNINWPGTEEELHKLLVSLMLTKTPAVFIDNVRSDRGPLKSTTLESILTTTNWNARILGKSDAPVLENKKIWAITVNNCQMNTDLLRRSIRIRLVLKDGKPTRPEDRKIQFALAWTQENRSILVSAALDLIMRWFAAGQPVPATLKLLESFEDWARVIGGILTLAGYPDFDGNRMEMNESNNSEEAEFTQFLEAWDEEFGEVPAKISELLQLADDCELLSGRLLGGNNGEHGRKTRMGMLLLSKKDQMIDGFTVIRATGRENRYKLVKTEARKQDDLWYKAIWEWFKNIDLDSFKKSEA